MQSRCKLLCECRLAWTVTQDKSSVNVEDRNVFDLFFSDHKSEKSRTDFESTTYCGAHSNVAKTLANRKETNAADFFDKLMQEAGAGTVMKRYTKPIHLQELKPHRRADSSLALINVVFLLLLFLLVSGTLRPPCRVLPEDFH